MTRSKEDTYIVDTIQDFFVQVGHETTYAAINIFLKFGHSEKATKFETISHLIWHSLSKRQIKWGIVSNFVAFLENLNCN